jgi:hypothetical protein
VVTPNSASYCFKTEADAYEDALDTIRFYAAKHPEWKQILGAIEKYVFSLEKTAGLHEPGV